MANNRARTLRKSMTTAERKLWSVLRLMKARGFHFRKQVPFGAYVADFACHAAKLIVELDGDQHALEAQRRRDEKRTAFLNSRGYHVLRFWNHDLDGNIDGIFAVIEAALIERAPFVAGVGATPTPTRPQRRSRRPSPQGGGRIQ